MNSPVSDLLKLGRMPAAVTGDIRTIADAMLRVSVIERTLIALLAELRSVGGEITRVRGAVEPQQQKIAKIERTMQTLDRRTAVIEQAIIDLNTKADTAAELLPDPDDDDRSPLEKARDVITGASANPTEAHKNRR